MSLRNRELVNLLVVGILTGLGFASVFIAQQAVISTASPRVTRMIEVA